MLDETPEHYLVWFFNYLMGIGLYFAPFLIMIEVFGFTNFLVKAAFFIGMPFYLFVLLTAIDDSMSEVEDKLDEAVENRKDE